MGIRTRCPNGHDLHVKAYLAGKLGICPQCGAKVQIPSQTDPPGVSQPTLEGDRSISIRSISASQSVSEGASGAATRDRRPASGTTESRAAQPAKQRSDPIAESPDALWYVRPPGGDQHGPTDGPTLRRWIAEGRLTDNTLVWREGWEDWRTARSSFGGLLGKSAATVDLSASAATISRGELSESESTTSAAQSTAKLTVGGEDHSTGGNSVGRRIDSRRGKRRSNRFALLVLVVMVAVLLPIAIYVMVR